MRGPAVDNQPTNGRIGPTGGRFEVPELNLIRALVGLSATVFKGHSWPTGVADDQRSRGDPAGRVANDNRAVGSPFLRGPECESAPVCRDPDVFADRVNLQNWFTVIDCRRHVPIAVIEHNPTPRPVLAGPAGKAVKARTNRDHAAPHDGFFSSEVNRMKQGVDLGSEPAIRRDVGKRWQAQADQDRDQAQREQQLV